MHALGTMLRLASVALVAGGCVAHAQPVYEIEYQFNDESPVVETRSRQFWVVEDRDLSPLRGIHDLEMAHFRQDSTRGLVGVWGEIAVWAGSDDTRPALFSSGRTSLTYTDVVFSSPGTEPIRVGLTYAFGRGIFLISAPTDGTEPEILVEVEVELEGDVRS
ncbi:MAG: hypothetical protein AAFV77_01645, partial [Planctomycetota bacterium]